MEDLGPSLLPKGILVNSSDLKNFLHEHYDFLMGCRKILFNNEPVEVGALLSNAFDEASQLVKLSVEMTVPRAMESGTSE